MPARQPAPLSLIRQSTHAAAQQSTSVADAISDYELDLVHRAYLDYRDRMPAAVLAAHMAKYLTRIRGRKEGSGRRSDLMSYGYPVQDVKAPVMARLLDDWARNPPPLQTHYGWVQQQLEAQVLHVPAAALSATAVR